MTPDEISNSYEIAEMLCILRQRVESAEKAWQDFRPGATRQRIAAVLQMAQILADTFDAAEEMTASKKKMTGANHDAK